MWLGDQSWLVVGIMCLGCAVVWLLVGVLVSPGWVSRVLMGLATGLAVVPIGAKLHRDAAASREAMKRREDPDVD